MNKFYTLLENINPDVKIVDNLKLAEFYAEIMNVYKSLDNDDIKMFQSVDGQKVQIEEVNPSHPLEFIVKQGDVYYKVAHYESDTLMGKIYRVPMMWKPN